MKTLSLLSAIVLLICAGCAEAQDSQDDWPNLTKYQAANATLMTPEEGQHRVVFMGNSITEGWSRISPDFFENKPYVNRGISGQTTPQMLVRFRQDVINLKPSVVVILAGINDIAGNTGPSTIEMIEANIVSMTELAMANDIEVVLCSVLPAKDFPWRPGMEPAPKVIALNQLIEALAERKGVAFVDYHSAMTDDAGGLREGLGDDGVHPNLEGYQIMEPLVEEAIARVLQEE